MFLILSLYLYIGAVSSNQGPEVDCLVKKMLFHKETGQCYETLRRGPCKQGEWIVLGSPHAGLKVNCM